MGRRAVRLARDRRRHTDQQVRLGPARRALRVCGVNRAEFVDTHEGEIPCARSKDRRCSSLSSRATARHSTRLSAIAKWAASLGYMGLQLPSSDTRFLDLHRCAESQTYADEITGVLKEHGLAVTELVTALQGQLVAVHPAYDAIFDSFAPPSVRGDPKARQAWAVEEMKIAARRVAAPRPQGRADLQRFACVALLLSLAAATEPSHRIRFRGARPALDAYPQRLR